MSCGNTAPLSQELFPLTILLFLLWVVVLFIALAVSADDYFCPSVEVMSRLLRSDPILSTIYLEKISTKIKLNI